MPLPPITGRRDYPIWESRVFHFTKGAYVIINTIRIRLTFTFAKLHHAICLANTYYAVFFKAFTKKCDRQLHVVTR